MARITPKTNWVGSNIPGAPDFNRIEGNAQQAFDEIDANEGQRAIDEATLQANIDAEEAARIADVNAEQARATAAENSINADLGGLDFVNGNAGIFGSRVIAQNERWVIPKGTYIFTSFANSFIFQIYSGSEWVGINYPWPGCYLVVDGSNFAITGLNVASPGTIYYRKLA